MNPLTINDEVGESNTAIGGATGAVIDSTTDPASVALHINGSMPNLAKSSAALAIKAAANGHSSHHEDHHDHEEHVRLTLLIIIFSLFSYDPRPE